MVATSPGRAVYPWSEPASARSSVLRAINSDDPDATIAARRAPSSAPLSLEPSSRCPRDCADAFGGRSRERALEIMRDHAIGAYGATALVLDVLIKGAALRAAAHGHVIAVAAAAGALSRGAPVVLASALPYARVDGTAPDHRARLANGALAQR